MIVFNIKTLRERRCQNRQYILVYSVFRGNQFQKVFIVIQPHIYQIRAPPCALRVSERPVTVSQLFLINFLYCICRKHVAPCALGVQQITSHCKSTFSLFFLCTVNADKYTIDFVIKLGLFIRDQLQGLKNH